MDIRKNLDFIGMRNFSLSLNGALIKSKVKFEPGAKEEDRPMQGQSPYLINAGFSINMPIADGMLHCFITVSVSVLLV